ncbi:hypothetical protein [Brasilonema bromeliae]|uniref:Uncharacterized protein n=1 Tax=Brasilonema bromeliae SPC951 TaxID=385972 RepID=A0ABX1P9K3_9CYAN|nr:hypothetical protein [Brasilonema bromeliae]NMG20708.1 hypothetical protein [Brasilonema bromeliae SPC951]
MLTIYQNEKVAIALKLIKEVQEQVSDTDIHKSILLGDAAEACDEVLTEDLPEGYTPPKEAWYSPERIKESRSAPSMGDRIVGALTRVAASTVVCAGLSACLSLGCLGVAQFKIASKDFSQPDFTAQGRAYLGLTMIFAAATGASLVLIAVADREVN